MNLNHFSDDVLLSRTASLAHKERALHLEVLHHLREIERRSLYALRGYPSLFEYAVQELKYSQGAAQRRISSMRLLKEIPEMEQKLERGEVSLSTLARAQTFFRQEKAHVKSREDKLEILKVLENKSVREVERELVCRSSDPVRLMSEKLRPVSDTHTELKVLLDAEMLAELEELKSLLSHAKPNASLRDLLGFALKDTVKRLRPRPPRARQNATVLSKGEVPQNAEALAAGPERDGQNKAKLGAEARAKLGARATRPLVPATAVESTRAAKATCGVKSTRYIPRRVKAEVWQREGGCAR